MSKIDQRHIVRHDVKKTPMPTLFRRALLALSSAVLAMSIPTLVQAQTNKRASLEVSVPNGYATANVEDLSLQSTAGPVKWMRVWNGQEWKFNPHWESLSQSWKNLTGSKVADTTGGGTTSGGVVNNIAAGNGGSNGDAGCWVMVDDDWEPTIGKTQIGGVPEASPLLALRSQPFNRMIGLDDYIAQANYPPVEIVNIDYANLCVGAGFVPTVIDFEAIRRQNELYLGNAGRYAFNNRTVLEKRPVSALPSLSATVLDAQLATGRITVSPQINAKGFRWSDRSGDWIDYNTNGQVVAYGDAHDNVVWLARDGGGIVRGVVDANGRVLMSLHYDDHNRIGEVRDYPIAGMAEDLPPRVVKYKYDEKNRIHVVTDARGYDTTYDYDLLNNIVKITDAEAREDVWAYSNNVVKQHTAPDKAVTDYQFDYDDVRKQFNSKITGPETDAGRMVETLTHNRAAKLVRQVVNGRTEDEVRYDTAARAEIHTNARGFSTRIVRNEFDQVVLIEYPDGTSRRNTFSAVNLQLLEEIDEAGVSTRYERDAKGKVIKKIEAVGLPEQRTTEYIVNGRGQVEQTLRKGRTEVTGTVTPDAIWKLEYDELGQIRRATDPESKVQRVQFNRAGQLVVSTDPLEHSTRYSFDALGNLTDVNDAISRHWHLEYDKVGNIKVSQDANGKASTYSYDGMNRLLDSTNPLGGVWKLRYNRQGLPILETDADDRGVQSQFDNFQRVVGQIDMAGNKTEFGYDVPDGSNAGMLGSLTQPIVIKFPTYTQNSRLDARERNVSVVSANVSTKGVQNYSNSAAFGKRGWMDSYKDAYDKTRYFGRDALGQLTAHTNSLNQVTKVDYDARGGLLRLTDANQQSTTFEYDRNGRVVKETQAAGQIALSQYDDAGNLALWADAKGNKVQYTYDAANRLKELRLFDRADRLERLTVFTLNDQDRLVAWEDTDYTRPVGQQVSRSDLTYDDAGRKKAETVSYPNPQGGTSTLGYAYDYSAAGRKTHVTWPDGTRIAYGYSGNGQIDRVDIPGEGAITVNEFKWLRPAKVTLPGGSTQDATHDGLLNLEGLKVRTPGQQTVLALDHTYGASQELRARNRTDSFNVGSSTYDSLFQYDDELRLTQAANSGQDSSVETFTVNAVGNRVAHSRTQGEWTYEANNRLVQTGTGQAAVAFAYDDAGNVTTRTEAGNLVTQFGYDGLNRLTEVKINGALAARYGYDPLYRRLWKEQYRNRQGGLLPQPIRTTYLYADEGLIAEANQAVVLNADQSVSANVPPQISIQYAPQPGSAFTTAPLFVKTRDSNGREVIAYLHHDHLGSPLMATDKEGNVLWAARYDAFGRATQTFSPTEARPAIVLNLRLPGQYFDQETDLHYNWHRYYSPETGRYLQEDPVGIQAGLNRYIYAGASPLLVVDPDGRSTAAVALFTGTIGAIAGAAGSYWVQKYWQKKCDINWWDVANAGAWGGVAGAALPILASRGMGGWGPTVAVGVTTNLFQYFTGQIWSDEGVTWSGVGGSVLAGIGGAWMGGQFGRIATIPAYGAFGEAVTGLPELAARNATRAKIGANAGIEDLVRGWLAGIDGNLPTEMPNLTCGCVP